MGTVADAKAALRIELLAARRVMTADSREADRTAIRANVLARRGRDWNCVAAYEPLATEPGSVELLAALTESGVRVIVPVTLPDGVLDWARWSAGDASPSLGLDAVTAADVILVPALAAGRDGSRLGRGRGYYDRALPLRRPGATVAALLFESELRDRVPVDSWDVPLTAVVTPSRWHDLA